MTLMMIRSFRRHAAQGFTLIELLIVVIIIAILAAIAIPQFANTSGDAQESALSANLSTMRSAIELYKVQHRNVLPSVAVSTGANSGACTTAGGVAGSGAINTAVAFNEQLTYFSNASGETCSVRDAGNIFALGPYLKTIPTDSITNPPTNAVVIVSTGTQDPAPTVTTGGYQFDNRSGRLVMNSNVVGRRAIPYWQY
jgi:prepilin-type N-terminal cleavage/methylation domain-containing protein